LGTACNRRFGGALTAARPKAATVPKATCGALDRQETGLQGQTPLADRQSGATTQAYNCNLEKVGQFEGEGASWQLTWFGDCAYYDTASGRSDAEVIEELAGTFALWAQRTMGDSSSRASRSAGSR
jgi:hypothetical protein